MGKFNHTHTFIPSDKTGYEICTGCSSYHSICAMDRVALYENDYWDEKNGHSFFGDQIANLTQDFEEGFSKVGKIMSFIEKQGPVLEIGCAPGVLLNRLRRKGYSVWGVEPDKKLIPEIISVSGCKEDQILHGYFPEVKLPNVKFDYIVAMDILEHIENTDEFIDAVYANLSNLGKLIIMLPLIKDGQTRERDFVPHEHIWIWQFEYIKDYLVSKFNGLAYDKWREGHHIFLCHKHIRQTI